VLTKLALKPSKQINVSKNTHRIDCVQKDFTRDIRFLLREALNEECKRLFGTEDKCWIYKDGFELKLIIKVMKEYFDSNFDYSNLTLEQEAMLVGLFNLRRGSEIVEKKGGN
jgi:hypothetical protein